MSDLDWSRIYGQRQAVADRFGKVWDLPLARRYYNVLAGVGRQGCRLLELGAGDRALQAKMRGFWQSFDYQSCDIDVSGGHDFHHIDEVTGQYDVICGFEMIEHVTLSEAHHILSRCYELLANGGKIALTTPNIFYPPAFLRDATHITPFCYDELGGLLQACGFEVEKIYRLHHDALLKKFLKRVVFYPLYRLLGIDYSHQIMVVAQKRES